MPISNCRVCGRSFFESPLLHFKNMPKAAQFLPDAGSLERDTGVDLDVYQCAGCGLVQLGNDPVPYYREVIRAAAISQEMKSFRMNQFRSFIERFSLAGRKVVEIGCGRGEFLSILRQLDVDAYGLEYSEESVSHCAAAGLKVSKGFIESDDYRLSDGPFSAFFILNFLEHLPSPNCVLRGIYNNLADDGIGLVEVPNFDMILKRHLFSEFVNDHLFYFTRQALSTALSLNGFEVIECNIEWHDYILSAVVRKRVRVDLSHFSEHQSQIKSEIERFINRFKKVAIWGAGHQALAMLSLAELGDKITYVVDSAPFKQGRYTPATHIAIVSPRMLESEPVDAIIVMAASYSDEVAGIIRQDFGSHISVSILRDFGLEAV